MTLFGFETNFLLLCSTGILWEIVSLRKFFAILQSCARNFADPIPLNALLLLIFYLLRAVYDTEESELVCFRWPVRNAIAFKQDHISLSNLF